MNPSTTDTVSPVESQAALEIKTVGAAQPGESFELRIRGIPGVGYLISLLSGQASASQVADVLDRLRKDARHAAAQGWSWTSLSFRSTPLVRAGAALVVLLAFAAGGVAEAMNVPRLVLRYALAAMDPEERANREQHQKKEPCGKGEEAVEGFCWVALEQKPPCVVPSQREMKGKCYLGVGLDKDAGSR